MLTKCAAFELAPYKIRVNGIAPGPTETESNQAYLLEVTEAWDHVIQNIPMGRAAKPYDIAGLAVFLASDEASYLTGVTIPIDGGALIT